jgi:hypothetical protein
LTFCAQPSWPPSCAPLSSSSFSSACNDSLSSLSGAQEAPPKNGKNMRRLS